ncbi:Pheromone-binding protein [Papilio machaon]|uniref:Pheromone-binding protein n=1 Tax=Papilio machaon TaxID=76193 RepID=A0A0N1PGR0_PAPMA|nr:Pheromone-binding protein [Papilio machaon]
MCVVVRTALLLLVVAAAADDAPSSIINEISKQFGSMMLYCVQLVRYIHCCTLLLPFEKVESCGLWLQLYPQTGYFRDVLDFWNRDLNITGHTYLGCLAACSLFKLQLRNRDGSLNETNIMNFLRQNGAVENDAAVLLEVFKTCQNVSSSERKACAAGLKTMICFRSQIYRLNWTPQFYRGPFENVLNGK